MRQAMMAAALVALAGCGSPMSQEKVDQGWTEDLPAALARAKAENKHALVLFTGRGW